MHDSMAAVHIVSMNGPALLLHISTASDIIDVIMCFFYLDKPGLNV